MAFSIPNNTISANLAWCETFRDAVVADPAAYSMTAPEAADVDTQVLAYRAAFDVAGVESRLAVDPAGYTKPARAALYIARDAALAMIEPLAGLIQADPGIADPVKLAAGVQPRTTTRTPIPPPSTIPVIGVINMTPGAVKLSLADSSNPSLKQKPYGATGAQLWAVFGPAPVGDPTEAVFIGTATRSPHTQNLDAEFLTTYCTLFARWQDNRGRVGDWSAPVSFVVT